MKEPLLPYGVSLSHNTATERRMLIQSFATEEEFLKEFPLMCAKIFGIQVTISPLPDVTPIDEEGEAP